MRHRRIGRKLGVTTKHRKSMLRNMVTDLFRNEKLKTTDTRAKEIRRVAEKIITLAKEDTLHKRRQAGAFVRDKEVLKKLFDELAKRFKERPGGYTRITKLGFRKGDNTPISIIELVEEEYKPNKKKKAKAAPKKTAKASVKDGGAKAKSSKKESAEELGLIEEEEKTITETVAEAAVVAGTVEAVTEETVAEEATAPEAKAEEVAVAESEPAEELAAAPAEESVEEPSAEAEPEEQIEAKAEEVSEDVVEESSEAEADEESEKKED
ncbi:MAG: 50S ribosomal protein L17 [Thermodesulfobacteriota bacterium]